MQNSTVYNVYVTVGYTNEIVSPSKQGNTECVCSPDLPRHIVKGDEIRRTHGVLCVAKNRLLNSNTKNDSVAKRRPSVKNLDVL